MASESPYSPPAQLDSSVTTELTVALEVYEPLFRRRIWLRIIGVVMMLVGGLYSLVLVGIPVVIAGYFLFQAASHIESAYRGDVRQLWQASNRLSQVLLICGILVLIWVCLMLLYVLFVISVIVFGVYLQ